MTKETSRGVLLISIDVDAARQTTATSATAERLLEGLDRHQLSATWSFARPETAPLAERLRSAGDRHEIALAADPAWCASATARADLERGLSPRLAAARDADCDVTTLTTSGPSALGHHDLLVKRGVRAIRTGPSAGADERWLPRVWRLSTTSHEPQALRWGLWRLPTALRSPGCGLMATRRGIDRAVEASGTFGWMLDLAQLATAGDAAMRHVERVLEHVVGRRGQGVLAIRTIASHIDVLSSPGGRRPAARSILRPAA